MCTYSGILVGLAAIACSLRIRPPPSLVRHLFLHQWGKCLCTDSLWLQLQCSILLCLQCILHMLCQVSVESAWAGQIHTLLEGSVGVLLSTNYSRLAHTILCLFSRILTQRFFRCPRFVCTRKVIAKPVSITTLGTCRSGPLQLKRSAKRLAQDRNKLEKRNASTITLLIVAISLIMTSGMRKPAQVVSTWEKETPLVAKWLARLSSAGPPHLKRHKKSLKRYKKSLAKTSRSIYDFNIWRWPSAISPNAYSILRKRK